MSPSTQVAVRLDRALLESLDWLVVECNFENRAEAIRVALTELAKRKRDEDIDARIRNAYEQIPEHQSERLPTNWQALDDLDDEDWSAWR
jgi:Arc/MetJ-type ribon-helix-helix transcriptional regulator